MHHLYFLAARAAHSTRRALLLSGLLALLLPGFAHATVYYVDGAQADNAATGLSWATAKRDVQAAINLATAATDEVWVKAGTYLPTLVPPTATATTARDQVFYLLVANIKLYGGFAGTETAAGQRNPVANPTTLSGDLDGPAGPADAHHVLLTANRSSACAVDGFRVQGARANGLGNVTVLGLSIGRSGGGGLYNSSSSPTVSGCTFSGNSATNGGAVFNSTSSSVVSGCTFSGNTAGSLGGGIYTTGSGSPTVSSCAFSGNSANNGGGMFNTGTGSIPVVSGCTFSGNSANFGGAMYNVSSPVVSGCTFSANSASNSGGAMYIASSSPTLSSCAFSGNTASRGGALFISNGTPVVRSCLFSANTATVDGGGISSNSGLTMSSCTLSGNSATGAASRGGGLYFTINGGATLTNCILYQNTTPNNSDNPTREELYKDNAIVALVVSSCIVRDYSSTLTDITAATNIYTTAPGYVDAANPLGPDGQWRTADDGLRLVCGSFAVDQGTGTTPATDLLGNPRKGLQDLGAYEAVGGTTPANTLPAAFTTVSGVQTAAALAYTDCQNELLQLNAASPYTLLGSTVVTVRVPATAPAFNAQPYVRRYYDITPAANPNTATAEVTLYFAQADFTDYNTARGTRPALPEDAADAAGYRANLRITQQHGSSATGAPGSFGGWGGTGPATVFITPTAVAYNAAAARWEVTFPVTGFSGFFAHTGASPLPVELTAFTATAVGPAAVRLAWATASERNSLAFDVERSLNGKSFAAIGTAAAAGSSSASRTYAFVDAQLPAGAALLYYRLRLVDADGTFAYSPVRAVTVTGPLGKGLTLVPNPARATTLGGAAAGAPVRVYDAVGRLVLTATADAAGTASLALPAHLPTGVYVVRSGARAGRLVVE